MKLLLLGIMIMVLTSCVPMPVSRVVSAPPPPPSLANYCHGETCDYDAYATDLNWYLVFMLAYTKSFNEYAISNGWVPSDAPPVCRLFESKSYTPLPEFKPITSGHGADFEWELITYIKAIKRKYTNYTEGIETDEETQRMLCTY